MPRARDVPQLKPHEPFQYCMMDYLSLLMFTQLRCSARKDAKSTCLKPQCGDGYRESVPGNVARACGREPALQYRWLQHAHTPAHVRRVGWKTSPNRVCVCVSVFVSVSRASLSDSLSVCLSLSVSLPLAPLPPFSLSLSLSFSLPLSLLSRRPAPSVCMCLCARVHAGTAGLKEECDDGNSVDGDGCSSSCTVEAGFTCEPVAGSPKRKDATGVGE